MSKSNDSDNDVYQTLTAFLTDWLSIRKTTKLTPSTRIFHDLGVDGDDAVELLEAYSEKFQVNLDKFSINQYFGEEAPLNPLDLVTYLLRGKLQADKKPLTIKDLLDGIEKGHLK
ncbi:DUF1493 family protein [Zooshikella harenae]|uniref:DUF1493 family protein n=1 Tax=Zooshikella harenae TaxID=2827238 RepID=A0ABS5ZJQ6_9GAMM|nr:DUF1493 family protein [Zooshikella harenae]MBU2714257.1 DUF1493 family protein [Zooshikella harenae]